MFFFILIIVIILLSVIIYAIHTSRIGIEVENLIIDTEQKRENKVNKENNIYVYLLIFGKIKLFKKNIKQMKTPNLKIKKQDIDIKILKDIDLKINYKELLRNIDVDIEKIDFCIKIGTKDALITAILVGTISAVLGFLIRKPKYEVMPVYTNKNLLKIKLDGIFSVYLMQYIYKLILKKWKQKIPGKIGSKIERGSI